MFSGIIDAWYKVEIIYSIKIYFQSNRDAHTNLQRERLKELSLLWCKKVSVCVLYRNTQMTFSIEQYEKPFTIYKHRERQENNFF